VNRTTGTRTDVQAAPGGEFQAELPPGEYDVLVGSASWKLALVSGGRYALTLDPERSVHFTLEVNREPGKQSVRLRLTAQGLGRHDFSVRVFNGAVVEAHQSIDLEATLKSELLWDLAVRDPNTPWVAVVVPDGDLTWKQEATGTLEEG
jgi:hypothetical protein